jgi:hypothetical protein
MSNKLSFKKVSFILSRNFRGNIIYDHILAFMSVLVRDRLQKKNDIQTLRDGQERWTVGNVQADSDQADEPEIGNRKLFLTIKITIKIEL